MALLTKDSFTQKISFPGEKLPPVSWKLLCSPGAVSFPWSSGQHQPAGPGHPGPCWSCCSLQAPLREEELCASWRSHVLRDTKEVTSLGTWWVFISMDAPAYLWATSPSASACCWALQQQPCSGAAAEKCCLLRLPPKQGLRALQHPAPRGSHWGTCARGKADRT